MFTGAKTGFTVREADLPKANLRFANGDSITLEAWVKVAELKDGSYAYLVGKGRNGERGVPGEEPELRPAAEGREGRGPRSASCSPARRPKDKPARLAPLDDDTGFTAGGWHHVAVAYTFGKPESIRGYIDGQDVAGTWDMGGATDRSPVTDADDLTTRHRQRRRGRQLLPRLARRRHHLADGAARTTR